VRADGGSVGVGGGIGCVGGMGSVFWTGLRLEPGAVVIEKWT
jgi:hypothetical protein